ncbi:MAG: hypothetical protein KatS3mg087_2211 [Patescibacteria group bacterium]|nr:MAG: hypothetical protein KatS3mg087_2211 [Patescibacteria group bacterium]
MYKLFTQFDFNTNEARNIVIHKATSAPTSPTPVEGQLYYNTSEDKLYYYDGASWIPISSATTVFDGKESVRVATTANITLSGTQTIDGVTLVAGDRVLVKNQTTASQNGIYVVASGAWSRSSDADAWDELVSAYVFVQEGTTNADTGWLCTANAGGTLGTTDVTWVQFSDTGQVQAGQGLSKTGSTLDVVVDDSTIKVNGSNQLNVQGYTFVSGKTVGRVHTSTNVALSSTATNITHNLNNTSVVIQAVESSTKNPIVVDYTISNANTVAITATPNVTADIFIIG